MEKRILKRLCYETNQVEMFVVSGQWENGYMAYSKLSLHPCGDFIVYDDDDCAYYQVRINGRLVMVHI